MCKYSKVRKEIKKKRKNPGAKWNPHEAGPFGISALSLWPVSGAPQVDASPKHKSGSYQTLEGDVAFTEFGGVSCMAQHAEKPCFFFF